MRTEKKVFYIWRNAQSAQTFPVLGYTQGTPTPIKPNAHTLNCWSNMIINRGQDCWGSVATRLGRKPFICSRAVCGNCWGKWDSPSNNSIVCLHASLHWFFLLVIRLLSLAGLHIQKPLMCAHARWHAHTGSPAPLRYLLKAHNDPSREVNQPPIASLAKTSVQDIATAGLRVCLSHNHTHTQVH